MSLIQKASENIMERLAWHTAVKDQSGIAKDLADGKEIEEVYGLGDAGLFDEFFSFLSQLGIKDLFMKLEPKTKQRNSKVEFSSVILIYLMRIVSGLSFFYHIGPVLLQSQSLMRLVGFNARQVREGTCDRGFKNSSIPDENEQNPDEGSEIRGPVCPQFIAASIRAIAASALERFFNKVISILAKNSFFPKFVHALLDASEIQSTEKCEGCGKVTKEKAPELRRRTKRIRKVLESVFGFKIWVVWEPVSKLPIAIRFTTIEVPDIKMAKEVVQQAVSNLGDHAKIVSLAFDRGFIDGSFMWWLHNDLKIKFYVPAKKSMNVYEDALSLTGAGIRETKECERTVGSGKNRSTVIDRGDLVGIENLTSAGFYGENGSGSHENSSDFIPNPINAVVVLHDPLGRHRGRHRDVVSMLLNFSLKLRQDHTCGCNQVLIITSPLHRPADCGTVNIHPMGYLASSER